VIRSLRPLAVSALLALGACSSTPPQSAQLSCPRVAVLNDLSHLTRFREGPGRDLTDIVLEAQFSGLAFGCKFDKQSVTVEIDVQIEAARGPALPQSKARFEYFAAVTNPTGEIVSKEPFTAEVEFKGNTTRLVVADELAQRIPLLDRASAAGWSVLLGLQLTEAENEWAKQRKAR
jgi:hypothetical protein